LDGSGGLYCGGTATEAGKLKEQGPEKGGRLELVGRAEKTAWTIRRREKHGSRGRRSDGGIGKESSQQRTRRWCCSIHDRCKTFRERGGWKNFKGEEFRKGGIIWEVLSKVGFNAWKSCLTRISLYSKEGEKGQKTKGSGLLKKSKSSIKSKTI